MKLLLKLMNWLPIVLPDGSLLWSQFFCLDLSAALPEWEAPASCELSEAQPEWMTGGCGPCVKLKWLAVVWFGQVDRFLCLCGQVLVWHLIHLCPWGGCCFRLQWQAHGLYICVCMGECGGGSFPVAPQALSEHNYLPWASPLKVTVELRVNLKWCCGSLCGVWLRWCLEHNINTITLLMQICINPPLSGKISFAASFFP